MSSKKKLVLTLSIVSVTCVLAIFSLIFVLVTGGQGFSTIFDIRYTSAFTISYDTTGLSNPSDYETVHFTEGSYTIEEPVLPQEHNKSLEGWYSDPSFTTKLSFPLTVTSSITIYPKMLTGTISDWIEWNTGGYYQVKSGTYTGSETSIVIPDYYNDGTHDLNAVTTLAGSFLYNVTTVTDLWIGNNIASIPGQFADGGTNLTSIGIGRGVKNIGARAFRNCRAVTEVNYYATSATNLSSSNYVFSQLGMNSTGTTVNVGYNVTKIPAYLFCPYGQNTSYNTNIKTVNFEGVSRCETISTYAFGGLSNPGITKITIPEAVTIIGSRAFEGCPLIEINYNAINCADLDLYDGFWTEDGCIVNIGENVEVIPAHLCGESNVSNGVAKINFLGNSKLKFINDYAFWLCEGLTELILPDSVEHIGKNAFDHCAISTLKLSSNLKEVDGYAFSNALFVEELIIPDSVTTIGSNAFSFADSNGVNSITIGKGVTSIGNYAFYGATSVTSFTYNAINCADFTSRTNQIFTRLGETNGTTLTFGDEVEKIPGSLFCPDQSSNVPNLIGSIVVPDSVTTIGEYAFYNSGKISDLTIGKGVTSIGYHAFNSCYEVTSFTYNAINCADFPSSNYIFYYLGNYNGTTITIGEEVQTLPNFLFSPYNSSSVPNFIGDLIIPDSVTKIGTQAFYYADNIKSITIGKGVTSIGTDAFYGATAVTSVTYNAINCADFTSTDNGVFYHLGSTNGSTLTIGNDVQNIPAYLFYPDVTTSYIPNLIGSVIIPDSVISIGTYAFRGADEIKSLSIGKGVASIGNYAFYGATAVTSFTYNAINCANLASSNNVFYNLGSSNGTTITIGNEVKTIPEYIFCPQTSSTYVPNFIGSIVIPDSVTSIGQYAFYYSNSITSLTIGKGVTSIGDSAFYYTSALTTIQYNATECGDLGSSNRTFYRAGYSSGAIALTIGANVKRIPSYIFFPYSSSSYRPYIQTVTFEDNSVCTYIGIYAFRYCTTITSVDFGTNTSGWWVSTSATATSGTVLTSTNLSSTTTADTYLTSTYTSYYWYRDTYAITLDANGGAFADSATTYDTTIAIGDVVGDSNKKELHACWLVNRGDIFYIY